MRAHALSRAAWIASSREGARAVRQDSRPSNTMQTSQLSWLRPNEEITTYAMTAKKAKRPMSLIQPDMEASLYEIEGGWGIAEIARVLNRAGVDFTEC